MDVAFKAVGVGSVGTICVVGLFLSADGEPLFLQVKQAQRSVLERLPKQLAYQGPQGRARSRGAAHDAGGKRHFSRLDVGRALEDRVLCSHPEEPPPRRGQRSSPNSRRCRNMPDSAAGRWRAAHARSGDPAVIAGYMGRNEAIRRRTRHHFARSPA